MITVRLSTTQLTDNNYAKILQSVKSRILRSPEGLSLDMRDVKFVSDEAIYELYALQTLAAEDGKRFVVFGIGEELSQCLDAYPQFPLNIMGQEAKVERKKTVTEIKDEESRKKVNYRFILKATGVVLSIYSFIYLVAVYVIPTESNWESSAQVQGPKSFESEGITVSGVVSVADGGNALSPVLILAFEKHSDASAGILAGQTYVTNGSFDMSLTLNGNLVNLDIYAINTSPNAEGKLESELREIRNYNPSKPIRLRFSL